MCSTYRGLWGLVVVRLSWLSGRALVAQARGVLGLIPAMASLFSFLYFRFITSKFISSVRLDVLSNSPTVKRSKVHAKPCLQHFVALRPMKSAKVCNEAKRL